MSTVTRSKQIVTPEFRVSYPSVFEPKAFNQDGSDAQYRITMLFDKSIDLAALKEIAKTAIEERWPDPAKRPSNLRSPFRDGDTEKSDKAGYENTTFVTATSSKDRPVSVSNEALNPASEQEFYAGCYARAVVSAKAYDHAGNRGVKFYFYAVQKLRDGEPLGGATINPHDVFEPVKKVSGEPNFDSMFD